MSAIVIRTASVADLETVVANNAAMAIETEGRSLDAAVLRAGVRRVLCDPVRGVYYLAQKAGKVVGQLLITTEWSDWRDGWFWWIQSVYVAPEARGQGVYRALHEYVEAEARRSGEVCGLRLYAARSNVRAQRVYERLGMSPSGYLLYELDWSRAAKTGPQTTNGQ